MRFVFTIPGVKSFLTQRICQDPLENFFGCQRQRGGTHDNPTVAEFEKNMQALRVINSSRSTQIPQGPAKGNCRGFSNESILTDKENTPLPNTPLSKRRKTRKN